MIDLSPDISALLERILSERPERADAIVWLQGDRFDRGPKVLELFEASHAPHIVLTGNDVLIGKGPRRGEDNVSIGEMEAWLASRGVPTEAMIVDRASHHTGEQATFVIELATARGWGTVLIVANPYHQLRAHLTFSSRATQKGWEGRIINQPIAQDWTAIPGGRDRTNEELLVLELDKINAYGLAL